MSGGYLNIPNGLKINSKFSSDEKLILAEIISLSKLKSGCIAGDEHFGEIINKSRQTANQKIKDLERKGYLELEVKPGIGKKTILTDVFWNLLRESPVKLQDTQEATKIEEGVELLDNTCQETGQVGVGNFDTTCRDLDTIITINNTSLKLQEELQYTGATLTNLEAVIDEKHKAANERILELLSIDPALVTNLFILDFYYCLGDLETRFGYDFFVKGHIFKSNNELYEIYGSSNFFNIRKELIFVRENMDRFLRQKNLV